jgi:hypothetical protein
LAFIFRFWVSNIPEYHQLKLLAWISYFKEPPISYQITPKRTFPKGTANLHNFIAGQNYFYKKNRRGFCPADLSDILWFLS